MNNLFNDALKGLGDFGDKVVQDAQNLVQEVAKRGEAMQLKPQPRAWEQKRGGYHRMGMNTPLGDDETASLAPSVKSTSNASTTPSVSSAQSEGGDSARSNTSERSNQSSLIRVLSKLMGRDTDAPLNQAPSPFDSKNPEKNNNKESGKSFSAMFTSLCNSAISFFKNLSKEESAKQQKTSSTEEPQKRVKQKPQPQPQQSSSGYGIGGLWKKLIPNGVFVQAENKNTGQAVRLELPFAFPKTGINPSAISFNPPTVKEMQKSARNLGSSFKAKAGNAAVALAGACVVASDGFNTQNIKDNIGGVASVVSFLARSSPSGSPSAFSAQNLGSGLSFKSSESMATTTKNAAKALAGIFASSGSSASYGSGRYSSGVSLSGGWLR